MIVDASVVAKWFMKGEEWEKEALDIRRKFEAGEVNLLAPSLIIYEIGNVIWKRKDISKEIASALAERITEYLKEITVEIDPNTAKKAIEIAREENITFYDATYVALSCLKKDELITADRKLYEKIKNKHRVRLINQI